MGQSTQRDMMFFTRRNYMQMCNRCGAMLQADTPRDLFEGGVYHIYCGWKLRRQKEEKEALRNKGVNNADTLPKGSRGDASVPRK